MAWTLDEWLTRSAGLDTVYEEELGRPVSSDRVAQAGWLGFHMRDGGRDIGWVRARIRESAEWQQRHGGTDGGGGGGLSGPEPIQPGPTPPAPPSPSVPLRPIRVTDASDGTFVHRLYSYWSNTVVIGDLAFVFAGLRGGGPRFFQVNLKTEQVTRLGTLDVTYPGETECWSWDKDGFIYLPIGPQIRRVNPLPGGMWDDAVLDISAEYPGHDLWQPHVSDDGQVISATVRRIVNEGRYPSVGTIIVRHGQVEYFPAHGTLDESQVTPDGEYVVIKETPDGAERVNNRIINLSTRETRTLTNAQGAVGHSDVGPGILVGEWSPGEGVPGVGACVLWNLREPLTPERRRVLFNTWSMGHLSIRGGRCLLSDATQIALVALDGSGVTHLLNHGSGETTGANLDPSGRVACYMSQGVVYLLVLP